MKMKWLKLYKESNDSDFIIKDGVLEEYKGEGGDVVIPTGVTSIGYQAFFFCTGLLSVTIPNSVKSIGDFAFYNCSGLTGVTIPGSVTSIGGGAFYSCDRLKSITIKGKSAEEAKILLKRAVNKLSIVKGNKTFVVRFKYSHRTDDEQEFNARSPEEARRKFEKWAADMECSEDFDFQFIDAEEEQQT